MKTNRIALYATLAVVSTIFAAAGGMKVAGDVAMADRMNAIGYDANWRLFIGLTELLGVVGLWIPRTRALALFLLWPYGIGGLAVHISHAHPFDISSVAVNVLIPVALWLDGRLRPILSQPIG
jgi:hypothetical protein